MSEIKTPNINPSGKSYQDLKHEMLNLPIEILLELLNNKSRKIGDTASTLIGQRGELKQLARAILNKQYTTVDGKVRAANTLNFSGANHEITDKALLYLVEDKNKRAAGNALFVLVALRRKCAISKLEDLEKSPLILTEIREKIGLAVKALKSGDPRIYSPHYGG